MSKRRYFEGESKAKPGFISDELRKALNIHEDKLPIWIYRMRVLGYPPGWLKEAQINTLTLFDGSVDGVNKDNTNNSNNNPFLSDCEDGEIVGVHYNKESLIEYPGFNVGLPQGVSDDWYQLRMPPMLEQQQLKEALKTMKLTQPVPYKRMKLEPTSTSASSTHQSIEGSSNYESTNPSLDSSKQSRDEFHIELNDSTSETKVNEELEEKHLNPLEVMPNESANESINCDKNVEKDLEIGTEKPIETLQNISSDTPSKSDSSFNTSSDSVRKLKLVSMGSPMPVSSNPNRPSLEKWSEGMGELIYFENLPTSTGVYKNKMKSVLDKIRQKNSQT